jgi:hypothetical protein
LKKAATYNKTKTKLVIEDEITYRTKRTRRTLEGIFSRTFSSTQSGDKYTVTINHRAQSGSGYRYNRDGSVVSGGKNYKPTESKVQVVTSRREKVGIKRLKILGIRAPFTRKL